MYLNPDKFEIDTDITIDDIRTYFRHNNNGIFFSMFETGLDGNRFDLIRVDPYRQYIRIFEFKSCRADFTSDKKWQNYLKYCHTFTFVCGREVIKREELPGGIGLLWIHRWRWKERPGYKTDVWHLQGEWQRRPRKKDVDMNTLNRIAFMLVHRTIWRKEDVF